MSENKLLTAREKEIIELVATGASNRQIAGQLHISGNTVKVHLSNIFQKLGVSSRTEATLYALRNGLVEVEGAQLERSVSVSGSSSRTAQIMSQPWILLMLSIVILVILSLLVLRLIQLSRQPDSTLVDVAQEERWTELAHMPTARSELALAVYEGQIYAIAGRTEEGVTDIVERYSPVEDTWETLEEHKPTEVADVEAALIGGKLYVPGGRLKTGLPTNVLEVYDPDAGVWESRAPLPKAMNAYGMSVFEGKLYLFGGWDGEEFLTSTYIYDPDQDAWSQGEPLSAPRGHAAVVPSTDGIYVLGGRNVEGVLELVEYYQPAKEGASESTWTHITSMPRGLSGIKAAGFADIIYVLGNDTQGEKPVFLEYLPTNEKWQELQIPFDATWTEYQVAGLGTEMYLLGGYDGETVSSKNYQFKALYTILIPIIR